MHFCVLALTIALSSSSTSPGSAVPNADTVVVAGTYVLQSLDAKVLPASITEGGMSVEVTASTMTLTAGDSIQVSTTFRVSSAATPITQVVRGTYRVQGTTLSFSYENGGTNSGTLNGSTLQMTNDGVVWLYRRN